jgi:hypothetical protein
LGEPETPQGRFEVFADGVGADARESPARFFGAESRFCLDAQECQDLRRG